MRAIDCEQGHDKIHLTGATDDELMEQVRQHAAEYHPDLGEDQLKGMFDQLVYDE